MPINQSRTEVAPPSPWAIPNLLGEILQSLQASSIDPSIAITTSIACMSLITQGVADIAWPNGMAIPIGISSLLVAPSGAGKSVTLRLFTDPIHRYLREASKGARKSIRQPLLFMEDSTREAIILHLLEWPVAGLFTDEGGQLKRLLKSGAPTLAKLTDGSPMSHARVSTGRADLKNHRFTMLVMEQPSAFEDSKFLLGAATGGVGLVNRFLTGTASALPSSGAFLNMALPSDIRSRYETRIAALLAETVERVNKEGVPPVLRLDPSAKHRFAGIADEIIRVARHDPRYATICEYTSRHAERVLRLAGAMHAFHYGSTGEVDAATLEAAHQIGLWSIEAFLALTQAPPKVSEAERDAADILRKLQQTVSWRGNPSFLLSELRRLSFNHGMTKPRFDRALAVLAGSGKVTLYLQGRHDWLYVNPEQMFMRSTTWLR